MPNPHNFPHGFYVPNHLLPFPKHFTRRKINISKLYVGVKNTEKRIEYVSIQESIIYLFLHDKFAKGLKDSQNIKLYREYVQENGVTQELELLDLMSSIKNNGIRKEYPPLVFRSAKRFLPFGRYDVADGHNRLCVMAAIGHKSVEVIYFKFKRPIFGILSNNHHIN